MQCWKKLVKNQNLLIHAFNELNQKGFNFILLVIGDGFDDNFKSRACEKIHFLGLKNNVSDYLNCADAFCLTSNYEGLPISLLEAISCGVVPICTNVGGISDVIEDGVTGFLSNVDKASYVDAIERYTMETIKTSKLISKFKNEFSIHACALKYLAIYENNR